MSFTQIQNAPFMESGLPKCPSGGKYIIGYYGQPPRCSLHGGYPHNGDAKMHALACEGDTAGLRKLFDDNYGPDGSWVLQGLPWTPLHSAALAGQCDVVRLLLEEGAKVNPLTQLGQTPLDLATDPDVIRILKEHGGREVFNVYRKRAHDIVRAGEILSVSVALEKPAQHTYRFGFALSNATDKPVEVRILSSLVCDISFNGATTEAEMPSSHAGRWLCPANTDLQLEPSATHWFDLSLEYEIDRLPGWSAVRSKVTGFWNDQGGYGASSDLRLDELAVAAWLLVDIKDNDEQIMGVPIYSQPLRFIQEQ